MKTALCIAGVVLLSACATGMKSAQNTCSVAPPATLKGDQKAALEAAADLKAFATFPVGGNFKAELSRVFDATFQKVPDAAAACAMLNQTYVCVTDQERAREYMAFMRSTQQCNR